MQIAYKLRDYQQRSIDMLLHWFSENPTGNPIIAMPTGSGKSLVQAEICRIAMGYDNQRVLMMVPSKELCEQNYEKLLNIIKDRSLAGILSASLGSFIYGRQIIVGTVGTIHNRKENIGAFDMMIIDEAHLTNNENVGMIRKTIDHLLGVNPNMRVVGLTATPFRGSGIWLHKTKTSIFTDIAAQVGMGELIDDGYLAGIEPAATQLSINAENVRRTGTTHGDFVISALDALVNRSSITDAACAEMARLGADRKSWIVFGVTIDHCTNITNGLLARGIDAELITGETKKEQRERMIRRHRSGSLRCLVSVGVLTTGFDSPGTDFIGMLRNTRSPVLWVQMVGRVMRPHENKKDRPALIADFTDNTLVMGPVNQITGRLPRAQQLSADDPDRIRAESKDCPECSAVCASSARTCWSCGYEFFSLNDSASELEIIAKKKSPIQTTPITDVYYYRHEKLGKPDSVRVNYMNGLDSIASEWICFEHEGYALEMAMKWWLDRRGKVLTRDDFPRTVGQFLDHSDFIKIPTSITVDRSRQYPKILKFDFTEGDYIDDQNDMEQSDRYSTAL